jgi:hypothetical protein
MHHRLSQRLGAHGRRWGRRRCLWKRNGRHNSCRLRRFRRFRRRNRSPCRRLVRQAHYPKQPRCPDARFGTRIIRPRIIQPRMIRP